MKNKKIRTGIPISHEDWNKLDYKVIDKKIASDSFNEAILKHFKKNPDEVFFGVEKNDEWDENNIEVTFPESDIKEITFKNVNKLTVLDIKREGDIFNVIMDLELKKERVKKKGSDKSLVN